MASNNFFRAICALLLAASLPAAALAGPRPVVHVVLIEGMQFLPAELTVHSGDTVVWNNKDAFPHTVTSIQKRFDSRDIAPGHSWKFVATKRGDVPYLCTLHRTMLGKLSVK